MKIDDIERSLREDPTIEPSPDFAARVMRAVREEAEDLGAIRFPWPRVVPIIVVSGLAIVLGVVSGRPVLDPRTVEVALQAVPLEIVVATISPLLGSWILVRFALRLAGYRE